jgi:3-deoxy-manno-octulosonate cytidylyltransferase (CMP-KDO synthetase)
MKILALIPARMGSTRFPGKPLKKIGKTPMIELVYKNVSKSKLILKTVVATCDKIIFDYVRSFGGLAVMTKNSHKRASDRCAEALAILEKKNNTRYNVILMVQGDEPMINSKMISLAIKPFLNDNSIDVVNLMGKIKNKKEFEDQNCIKVVTDLHDNALYFSRQPIPHGNHFSNKIARKQICVIPFRRNFLFKYIKLKPSKLEIEESIDMNRVLEYGFKVRMIKTNYSSFSVDTKKDLKKVQKLLQRKKYN